MNAMTQNWLPVGHIDDIPARGARCVKHGTLKIAIFRTADNAVFAIEDKCPHKGGPLSQGIVHDGCVTCPLHNWVISLIDGEAQGADKGCTPKIPLKVENGRVLLSGEAIARLGA
jgi:nitrite reductase (NADH) small subunit